MEPDRVVYDGPISWLVLLAIILCNMACPGYIFSTIGIFTAEYTKTLGMEPDNAALVGSVLSSTFLFSCAVVTILVRYHGCQRVAAVGCVLAILGCLSSAFATQLWHLIIGYSILSGFGFCLVTLTSIAIVPHYFKRRRNMAYTCTGLGSGIGFATYPYIYRAIRSSHSYQNSVLLLLPFVTISVLAPISFRQQIEDSKPESITHELRDYFKCMRHFHCIINMLNSICWNGGHIGLLVLLFSYVESSHDNEAATITQTIHGLMGLCGSICLTLLLVKFQFNHYILQIVCNCMAGVFCLVLALTTEKYIGFVSAGIIGFLYSVTISNIPCVCSHLFVAKEVNYSFGLVQVSGAIGSLVMSAIAGKIKGSFGNQPALFFLTATLLIGAAIFVVGAVIKRDMWTPELPAVNEEAAEGSLQEQEDKLSSIKRQNSSDDE